MIGECELATSVNFEEEICGNGCQFKPVKGIEYALVEAILRNFDAGNLQDIGHNRSSRNIFLLSLPNGQELILKKTRYDANLEETEVLPPLSPEDEILATLLFEQMLQGFLSSFREIHLSVEKPVGILKDSEGATYTVYEFEPGGLAGEIIQHFDDPPIAGGSFFPEYYEIAGIINIVLSEVEEYLASWLSKTGIKLEPKDFGIHQVVVWQDKDGKIERLLFVDLERWRIVC